MTPLPTVAIALVLILLAAGAAGALTWVACVAAALLCLASVALLSRRPQHAGAAAPRLPAGEIVSFLVLLFLLLSALPLPLAATRATGSLRCEQNRQAAQALEQGRDLGVVADQAATFSMTRNRAGTLRAAILMIAVFAAAWLSAAQSLPQKRRLLRFLVFLGAAIAAAGSVSICLVPQGATLWWTLPVPPVLPGPIAGFMNPNHFAGFLALLAPAALVVCADDFLARRWIHGVLSLLCVCLMLGGLVMSLSRGAFVAGCLGLLAATVTLGFRRRALVPVTLLLLMFGVLVALIALQKPAVQERLKSLQHPTETESFVARSQAWRSALGVWKTYPLVGAGANAFRMVHPQHRTTSESAYMTHPENEYLQVLAETGLAGALLGLALLFFAVRQIRHAWKVQPPDMTLLGAAAGAAVVAAAHSGVDFVLHVPLYAVAFATLTGFLLSPCSAAAPPRETLPCRSAWGPLLGLAILLGLSPFARSMQLMDSQVHLMQAGAPDVARALAWAPTSWHAWYYLGRLACLQNTPVSCAFGERCLTRAAHYDPNNYRLMRELGMLRLKLGDKAGAREAFARVRALRDWVKLPDVEEGAP